MITDIDHAYDWLSRYGKQVGKESVDGDVDAKTIVSAYDFHYKCPGDPGGQAFLMDAIDKYLKNHREENHENH